VKKYNVSGTVSKISITANTKGNGFALLFQMSASQDISVIKCDSTGNIEWKRRIAVKDWVLNWSIYQTALITSTKDGGYFIGAVANTYGEYYELNRLIIIRLDKNGNKLWNTSHEMESGYGNTDELIVDAIGETPDKGVVIAERYSGCESYCYNTHIYGFDNNGKYSFSRYIAGGSSTLYPFKYLTVTQVSNKDNSLQMIARVNNSRDPYTQMAYFKITQTPETTIYLLQDNIFALGDFLTNKSVTAFRGKNIDQKKTTSLFRNDGSIFQAGSTWDQYDTQRRICPDYTVTAIDTAFTKNKDLISAGALLTEKSDSVSASGFAVSAISIPPSVQTVCSGTAPGFATAVEVTDVKTIQVKNQLVYPNPAKDILHIQVSGKADFSLINQAGKTLITATINNKGEMNIAHLPAGLYYLKNHATGSVQKVIVNK